MSLPDPSFPFRLEHPDVPGVVFDLAHTEAQAKSKVARLLELHEGYVIVPNIAGMPPPAAAPEIAPPDTLTLWLDELVQLAGSRDAAYKFLFDHLAIAQGHLQDVEIAAAVLRGETADAAEPTPPPVCPFDPGNQIGDKNSDTLAVVDSIDDAAGMMHVLLSDGSTHDVPAINYGDFKLVEKSAPKDFFMVKPKAEPAPVPAAPPARVKAAKKHAKRGGADLLKKKPADHSTN